MWRWIKWHGKVCAIVGAVFLNGACTYAPENNEWVDWSELQFNGYAENPNALIEIQAFNKYDNRWHTVKRVRSSTRATTLSGDSLYGYTATFDFTRLEDWTCYWGYEGSCSIPAGSADAKFRIKEVGSNAAYMTTFEEGGVDCVLERMTDLDESWFTAGLQCASPASPVITLKVLT